VDWFGQAHGVLWSGARKLRLPQNMDFDKWFPVRIRKNALKPGVRIAIRGCPSSTGCICPGWRRG
jgi:hypothetical protein